MESQESLTKKTNLRKYRSKTYISLFHNLSQSSSKENNVILEKRQKDQQNRIQVSEIHHGIYGQMIFYRVIETIQWIGRLFNKRC